MQKRTTVSRIARLFALGLLLCMSLAGCATKPAVKAAAVLPAPRAGETPDGSLDLVSTLFQLSYRAPVESQRIARLCAYLRHRDPDDNVGHSILIYRLNAEEIRRAQYGPPVELLKDSQSPYPG